MFQRNVDAGAGADLAFVTFPTFAELLAGTGGTSVFSQINVAAGFTSSGIFAMPGDPPPQAIPLPATIWLLGAGLGGLLLAGRRGGVIARG